jgi:hypothetical protein
VRLWAHGKVMKHFIWRWLCWPFVSIFLIKNHILILKMMKNLRKNCTKYGILCHMAFNVAKVTFHMTFLFELNEQILSWMMYESSTG